MSFIDKVRNIVKSNDYSFKYLDDLIHSGQKEIVLDHDIVISDGEEEKYSDGIDIDVDNLVIDGNNHTINALKKSQIFNILANNILIKNITFKYGFSQLKGSVTISRGSSTTFVNCYFVENEGRMGGAITNWGSTSIIDSKFEDNVATQEGGAINNQLGQLNINGTLFINNSSPLSGALLCSGETTIEKCTFDSNIAYNNSAGAITNVYQSMKIIDSTFIRNKGVHGSAINNREDGEIEIISSTFKENISENTCSIHNSGQTSISKTTFSENEGGAIWNQENYVQLKESFITNNHAIHESMIINIQGSMDIISTEIVGNISNSTIHTENSTLSLSDSLIKDNKSTNPLILSIWGEMDISNSQFISNTSNNPILINNQSNVTVKNVSIDSNNCDVIVLSNQKGTLNMFKTQFKNHESEKNIIVNSDSMELMDCTFENNTSDNIIENTEDSILTISSCNLNDNSSLTSAISNNGKSLTISNTGFNKNRSDKEYCDNIINSSYLLLVNPTFSNDMECVLNRGYIETKKLSLEDIEKYIHDEGEIEPLDIVINNDDSNFSYLDNIIHSSSNVVLDRDIILDNFEKDFYEGGIDLDVDNLVIDGQGHTINARNKTRFFNVIADEVTIRNLVFKNGKSNNPEVTVNGGGALKLSRCASLTLENCNFIDNKSNNGGAIYNSGGLKTVNNIFNNNCAIMDGGAVYNRNYYNSKRDTFEENKSRVGSCIFNGDTLLISDEINVDNNQSNFKEDIFNVNKLDTENFNRKMGIIVIDLGSINAEEKDIVKSFTYLAEQIRDSDEVILDYDIKYDHKVDKDLKDGLIIEKSVTIDGKGHFIDGSNSASIFDFRNVKSFITLKNIVFKNMYSNKQSIINNKANINITECEFINNNSTANTSLFDNKQYLSIHKSRFGYNRSNKSSIIINNNVKELASEVMVPRGQLGNKLIITDSAFEYNFIYDGDGGVITNNNGEIPQYLELKNSVFNSNLSNRSAGAIQNRALIKSEENIFINNECEAKGGAINNEKDAKIELINTQLLNNKADDGGAIFTYSAQNIRMEECKLDGNIPGNVSSMIKTNKDINTIHDEKELQEIIRFDNDMENKAHALLQIIIINNMEMNPELMFNYLIKDVGLSRDEAIKVVEYFLESLNRVLKIMNNR